MLFQPCVHKVRLLFVLVGLISVAGCTHYSVIAPAPSAEPASVVPAPVASTEVDSGFSLPSPPRNNVTGYEVLRSGPVLSSTVPAPVTGISGTNNDINFNFVNADVTAVARTIFGQLLKENYTVDGGVHGTITLQTTRPLTRQEVIPALETSLQMANLALTHEADGYHIVPLASAAQAGAGNISVAGEPQTPGYGYEIIPLKYANAASVQTLIQPLAQSGVQIQIDAARNLLIVAGTSQQRAAIAANVAVFDVDWLAGMSYALVPLQNASAAAVSKEVRQIIQGGNSPINGLVRLVVIGQLNAILVVSPQAQYIPEIKNWITRFDQEEPSDERQVFVYRVQNGEAKDIAGLLNNLLGQTSEASNAGTSSVPGQPDNSSQTGDNGSALAMQSPSSSGPLPSSGISTNNQSDLNSSNNADFVDQASSDQEADNTDPADQPPRITADNTNNALLIYATPDQYRSLESALVQLDIAPQQVMIEAVVAEVTLTNQLAYGVQYFFQSGRVTSINTSAKTNSLLQLFPGFSAIWSPAENIHVLLNALESVTHVNVLSAPKLMVLNNQPAMLQVGDDVPITTQTAQSTDTSNAPLVSTIQYQNTGVILHVTPRINAGGLVTLDLTQEVSEVSTTTSSTLNSPTISERKISTIVAVPDGQTIALGGLIQSNDNTDNSGVPLLDRIPLLGELFSNHNISGTRTELLVMITPHVVQSVDSMQAVTNEVRDQLSDVQTQ